MTHTKTSSRQVFLIANIWKQLAALHIPYPFKRPGILCEHQLLFPLTTKLFRRKFVGVYPEFGFHVFLLFSVVFVCQRFAERTRQPLRSLRLLKLRRPQLNCTAIAHFAIKIVPNPAISDCRSHPSVPSTVRESGSWKFSYWKHPF